MLSSAHLDGIANETSVHLENVALAYIMQKAPHVVPIIESRKIESLNV